MAPPKKPSSFLRPIFPEESVPTENGQAQPAILIAAPVEQADQEPIRQTRPIIPVKIHYYSNKTSYILYYFLWLWLDEKCSSHFTFRSSTSRRGAYKEQEANIFLEAYLCANRCSEWQRCCGTRQTKQALYSGSSWRRFNISCCHPTTASITRKSAVELWQHLNNEIYSRKTKWKITISLPLFSALCFFKN